MTENLTVLDARHKEQAWTGLARLYADNHDLWGALHAQAAADIAAAVVVSGAAVPPPAAELLSSADAFDDLAARDVLDILRERLAALLSEQAREQFHARLADPSALFQAGDRPDPAVTLSLVAGRTGGLTIDEYARQRAEQARLGYANAVSLASAGNVWDAVVAGYEADVAAFEAWLLTRSELNGDLTYVHAEMTWALAMAALEQVVTLPEDPTAAAILVRSRLAWAVGPAAAADLAAYFDALI